MTIEAIVLAAGSGRRLGRSKPLLSLGGRTLIEHVLNRILAAGIDRIAVVLGRDADRVRQAVNLSAYRIVVNPDPDRGMGTSLTLALSSLPATIDGVLVFHVDMPAVRPETIRSVVDRAECGARIAAPSYDSRRGFPVYFDRLSIAALLPTLEGEIGGRRYIAEHKDDVDLVSVDDPGCLADIDRPDDLLRKEVQSCTTCG